MFAENAAHRNSLRSKSAAWMIQASSSRRGTSGGDQRSRGTSSVRRSAFGKKTLN